MLGERTRCCNFWWITAADLTVKDKGENYGLDADSKPMTALNWAEGVTIAMNSGTYQHETVALLTKLMQERGIPVVYFKNQPKGPIKGLQERQSNCLFSIEGCGRATNGGSNVGTEDR